MKTPPPGTWASSSMGVAGGVPEGWHHRLRHPAVAAAASD